MTFQSFDRVAGTCDACTSGFCLVDKGICSLVFLNRLCSKFLGNVSLLYFFVSLFSPYYHSCILVALCKMCLQCLIFLERCHHSKVPHRFHSHLLQGFIMFLLALSRNVWFFNLAVPQYFRYSAFMNHEPTVYQFVGLLVNDCGTLQNLPRRHEHIRAHACKSGQTQVAFFNSTDESACSCHDLSAACLSAKKFHLQHNLT